MRETMRKTREEMMRKTREEMMRKTREEMTRKPKEEMMSDTADIIRGTIGITRGTMDIKEDTMEANKEDNMTDATEDIMADTDAIVATASQRLFSELWPLLDSSALPVAATDADADITMSAVVSAMAPHTAPIARFLNRRAATASTKMPLRHSASTMVRRTLKLSPQGILKNLK